MKLRTGFLIYLLLVGCSSPESMPADQRDDQAPLQTTYDYHTTQTRGGQLQWELWGESAIRYPNDPLLYLSGVRMRFYEEGQVSAELTSEAGEVDETTYNTTATGNVVVTTEDEKTLRSEILHWDNAAEIIHSEAYVEFTEADQVLTGYGLRTDPDLSDLTLRERVEGSATDEEAPESTGNGES